MRCKATDLFAAMKNGCVQVNQTSMGYAVQSNQASHEYVENITHTYARSHDRFAYLLMWWFQSLLFSLLYCCPALASLDINTRKASLVKVPKAGSKPRRNACHSSLKHPKKRTKSPKESTKPPKKGTKAPKSTKAPKNILKSKKESEKPDIGATPSSIEHAFYSRDATIGFHEAVMASVILWWI